MKIEKDLEFLYEIGSLRNVERTWQQFFGRGVANVSEHSFRVMWIALIIAKHENADSDKVLKMALMHDITESRTGDVHHVSRMYTKRDEDSAFSDIIKGTSMGDMEELWKEYEERKTVEAKIVKDADNLDVDIEIEEQWSKGNKMKDAWRHMRDNMYENKFYTETARRIWKAIQESDPNSWQVNCKNRFNDGDWKR